MTCALRTATSELTSWAHFVRKLTPNIPKVKSSGRPWPPFLGISLGRVQDGISQWPESSRARQHTSRTEERNIDRKTETTIQQTSTGKCREEEINENNDQRETEKWERRSRRSRRREKEKRDHKRETMITEMWKRPIETEHERISRKS